MNGAVLLVTDLLFEQATVIVTVAIMATSTPACGSAWA